MAEHNVLEAELLSESELAARLRVSRQLLGKLRRGGGLPHIRIGKVVRFDPRRVEEWFRAQERS